MTSIKNDKSNMLKKILILLSFCVPTVGTAIAGEVKNPIFGDLQNQVKFDIIAYPGSDTKNIRNFFVSYGQPGSFLRLKGRRNILIGYMSGKSDSRIHMYDNDRQYKVFKSHHDRDLSQWMAGISQDIIIYHTDNFYFGAGIGPYVKEGGDTHDFVGSQFIMGERLFIGYRIGNFGFEIVANHFSDGHLAVLNRGFNGIGAGIHFNF